MSVAPLVGSSGLPPTVTLPLPGPRLTVPLVAVMEAEPEKFGEVLVPLPDRVAEVVVIVYVPAGSVWPLSVRPPPVRVIETLPMAVAEYSVQSPLTPRLVSAEP